MGLARVIRIPKPWEEQAMRIAIVLALAISLAACNRSEAPPPPPDAPAATPGVGAAPPAGPGARTGAARVASVELGSALDPTRRVVEPKSAFAPTDTIYLSVATEGWADPVTLTVRWTYEDGEVVNESSQTAEPGPSTTEFHIAKPSGWPAGRYQVEILADGASAATRSFEIR